MHSALKIPKVISASLLNPHCEVSKRYYSVMQQCCDDSEFEHSHSKEKTNYINRLFSSCSFFSNILFKYSLVYLL